MIRGSAFVAIAAILLSLLAHLFGLSFTAPNLVEQPVSGSTPDSVELGNAFEDFAETAAEPVQPEPAEVPDPPVEAQPEPEPAEVPVSEALVASPDPKQVYAPDTGASTVVQPEAPKPEVTEAVDQSEGEEAASDDTTATPPVEPDTVAETPLGSPDASTAPVTPETEQLAALPPPAPTAVPVIPLEREAIDPEIPDTPVEPVPEDTDSAVTNDETGTSEQAVTASIRPRLPDRPSSTEPKGTVNGSRNFENLRYPEQLIDSPLTVYRREGVDAFKRSSGRNQSGGRGPGNSDTTNYAGEVLVHLNRAPIVYVAARGFARVFFEINPDGTLAWVDVIESSGSPDVDRAAKEQVRTASPFPRPPGGVSRKLSFFYQIN